MTGPILFFLGVEYGDAFVARAAAGVLVGTVGVASYLLAFASAAKRVSWPITVAVGSAAFFGAGLLLNTLQVSLWVAALCAVASLFTANLLMPRVSELTAPPHLPWWDIPMRMIATAALVSLITLSTNFLEPEFLGVVATYPVIVAVVSAFTHARWGWQPAILLVRGVSMALLSFVAFFLMLGATVEHVGLVAAFALAAAAALVVSSAIVVFNGLRRNRVTASDRNKS